MRSRATSDPTANDVDCTGTRSALFSPCVDGCHGDGEGTQPPADRSQPPTTPLRQRTVRLNVPADTGDRLRRHIVLFAGGGDRQPPARSVPAPVTTPRADFMPTRVRHRRVEN